MALISGSVLILLLGYTVRTYRRLPVSGSARMLGARAKVIDWTGNAGFVWVEGERWQAQSDTGLHAGQNVRIRAIKGLTLLVEPDTRAEQS
nr:NfeD family protein [Leisingera sp. ANG59]